MCLNCTGECNDIELKEKLGEGGQGAVYKAVLKSNGKLIAVKKMNAACLDTEEKEVNINFFIQVSYCLVFQLSTLKGIRHKNIVEFYGVTKDPDGSILILMGMVV